MNVTSIFGRIILGILFDKSTPVGGVVLNDHGHTSLWIFFGALVAASEGVWASLHTPR
ncbi:hypothetical protein TSTA_048560 [Talaromyces stipitatus ATCC 10500]|uniref:Uncharacterized protein n=1 Tax=Talaromyces stipitatus (strain ATCC 10500 / CBS 375.48 / QM 6759 / NRRL 1006) TaxID=441959 RepID=B8ML00_TALSN|nr:uncharacterized protein TSTA_048560 [Talaromyces stipitatus ATCC 10500]EED15416.1 hypothetical protein TSTA_048560 [Talaromyces stipitatus ATCC 10500]